jgi:proline iminopeptidase
MKTTSIPVRDVQVACTVVGEGTPLIVVHGPGLGSTYMRGLDPWAETFQLVYYDQRGTGGTPLGDPDNVSFAGAIEDLDTLRAALGIERATLVGHSAGATIAALYAGSRPESTSAVVLLNTAPPLSPELQKEYFGEMAARRTPEDNAAMKALEESPLFQAQDPATVERHWLNSYIQCFRERATIENLDLGFTKITAANLDVVRGRMFKSLGAIDPMGTLAGIQCPALVVHSDLDPVPDQWAHALVDTIPGADFVLLEGSNHFAHIEDPAPLANVVLPWLAKHTT